MDETLSCPYCSTPVTPTPKRGRPCPHCGEKFYVRGGQLYTWAGAQEHDKAKRRRYRYLTFFCPNCGNLQEGPDITFYGVSPCYSCKHYINWEKGETIPWERVKPWKSWYDPYFPIPGTKPGASCCIEIGPDKAGYFEPSPGDTGFAPPPGEELHPQEDWWKRGEKPPHKHGEWREWWKGDE